MMELVNFEAFMGSSKKLTENLDKFINEHGTRTNFNELNEHDLRKRIWSQLFTVLSDDEYDSSHAMTLAALRILSRDKTNIDEIVTEERIGLLLKFADLIDITNNQHMPSSSACTVEALKLLCNLIYNSKQVRTFIIQTSCLSHAIQRISKHRNELTHEGILFHLRLLFLVTALCINTRNIVKNELNGDVHLIEILVDITRKYKTITEPVLKKEDVSVACEILKVLFNLCIGTIDEQIEMEKYKKLVSILRQLLLHETVANENEMKSHVINLLTAVPTTSYSALIPLVQSDNEDQIVYRDKNMTAISVMLVFLNQRLGSEADLTENISPVLTVLIRLSKAESVARKYIRLQILPPLKDVMKRPEEGTTIRARMCQQLTSPHTDLRDLVAELIFVLCKENVGRMVKYTGYGNAAGMFANKGLLGGRQSKTNYSSESEDSETDEYIKYKERINPITGCYESPKPSPMEGMSEERKEYEALQLAQLMDKLTREGIVQPCRIGEDGRPKPIEHVLELQSDPN